MIFKCKMCGGTIEFTEGATVGVCDSCGTKQTLPRIDDDRRANLYDRANHFRRNNEFDKAAAIYEQILTEDSTDAEAYWSLVLCQYGIEYVEDPATRKRVPTVNRAQFTSIFDDDNYKSAIQYADGYQREIYEKEAKTINDIQKGILAISQKEEPFDVFICYKETDNNGRRTPDSVLANDLYHQLTQEGFKVFFSRITLEDKLGSAYEPYIFAALNSAKVMVVLGTRPEYFNAVWVKNEWSRFLALVKKSGGKKILIPAYKDMDPYDLPEEFSHLQAQDMSKLGFMQDLIRGIKKIAKVEDVRSTVKETVVVGTSNVGVAPLLRRVFLFLEDGNWEEADAYCEKVLDLDPENAEAYLGKLMAELKIHHQEDLADYAKPFDYSNNYQKAVRFGGDTIAPMLSGFITHINERNELAGETPNIDDAADSNEDLPIAKETKKNKKAIWVFAVSLLVFLILGGIAVFLLFNKDQAIESEQPPLESSVAQTIELEHTEEEIQTEEKETNTVDPIAEKQKQANALLQSGNFDAAYAILEEIGQHDTVVSSKYDRAVSMINSGDYNSAIALLNGLYYKDSESLIQTCKAALNQDNLYRVRKSANDSASQIGAYRNLESAKELADENPGYYVFDKNGSLIYPLQSSQGSSSSTEETYVLGSYEQDNNLSNGAESIEWVVLAVEGNRALVTSKYALDCKPFSTELGEEYDGFLWKGCSLRKWLNGTFLNTAFTSAEQSKILNSKIASDSLDPSEVYYTYDKVFVLTQTQVERFFNSDAARQCKGTPYCYSKGADEGSNGNCTWWIRVEPFEMDEKGYVFSSGSTHALGYRVVGVDQVAVRPAMWISLE